MVVCSDVTGYKPEVLFLFIYSTIETLIYIINMVGPATIHQKFSSLFY